MEINISDLEIILEKVGEFCHEKSPEDMKIEKDNYLIIGSNEWFDILKNDIKPGMGSLEDDWDMLRKNVINRDMVTAVDLERLAAVLRAVSQKINSI